MWKVTYHDKRASDWLATGVLASHNMSKDIYVVLSMKHCFCDQGALLTHINLASEIGE